MVGHVIISFIELSDGKEAKAVSFPEDKLLKIACLGTKAERRVKSAQWA